MDKKIVYIIHFWFLYIKITLVKIWHVFILDKILLATEGICYEK